MGAIPGLLGLAGGTSGTGQTITPGTNSNQLNTAYAGAQNSLGDQQALLQALQQQNGIGNQSQVYNQLQGVANGTGPNPAQTMLNQATGQNTANQAALMAGQRGASANPGLIARQAAMQGAANQENTAGQAATLQANQSLNALGQAGNIANTQAGNQIGATTTNTQANQSEQGILQGANSANNAVNGQLANTTQQGQQGLIGGTLSGIGTGIAALAQGGVVPKYADGGAVGAGPQSSFGQFLSGWTGGSQSGAQAAAPTSGPSALSAGMSGLVSGGIGAAGNALSSGPAGTYGMTDLAMPNLGDSAGIGGSAPSLMGAPAALSQGGNVGAKLKSGGGVPGKAKVPGNSYANDTVKAKLSPGEGVIDRETMQDKGPTGQMARLLMTIVNAKKKGAK